MMRTRQLHGVRRILVTGASGQVGYELLRALAPVGNIVAPTSSELNLAEPDSIRRGVRAASPDVIVNAGGFTDVDRAEIDRERCFAINAYAPGVLAEEARKRGAALVHYSSDYVFDGTTRTPYTEVDAPCPKNAYGESKLAGERAITSVGGGYVILRTSWVYGARGTNFLCAIRRLARENCELRVVSDQVGAPTWSRAVAEATALVLAKVLHGDGAPAEQMAPASGVYHLTANGSTTWFDFARMIIEKERERGNVACERVIPVTTSEYGARAPRPLFSVLDNSKLRSRFGCALPDWAVLVRLALD